MNGKELKVNFIDLKRQYNSIKDEIGRVFLKTMDDCKFILGPELKLFESEFARFCNAKYCIGVNSGTSALYIALLTCGVGEGDEVITAPNSFIATALAITFAGAIPVFVDIDESTYNMDVSLIRSKITKKTKALIPVHLYGQPANMDEIISIAREYDLIVIEDACQAHGAECKSRKVGSLGDIGCFSFYPGKNLGAYGDGGAIVTNNYKLADNAFLLRNYGQRKKYFHESIGMNDRLDSLQAAFLRVKLKYLSQWNEKRIRNASIYGELLKSSMVKVPYVPDYCKSVFHLYVIRTKKRNGLQKFLNDRGISTFIHYPVPIHLQKAYSHLNHAEGEFPITKKVSKEILSLPIFPELKINEIEYVTRCIMDFENEYL